MQKSSIYPEEPLARLAVADPELAERVADGLAVKRGAVSREQMALLVEESIWGLSQEITFGRFIAKGYVELIGNVSPEVIEKYRSLLREAADVGPTLGRIMAEILVPVLTYGDAAFLEHFRYVVDIMCQKGTYTLKSPLEALPTLLHKQDMESVTAYMDLLCDTFSQELSYTRCQDFSYMLPRAVLGFTSAKRIWHIRALQRVIRADYRLTDAFLDGLKKGLNLLSEDTLYKFVSLGLNELTRDWKSSASFLSLESRLGLDTFTGLQVTVGFYQVQHRLNRYLRARTGLTISVRPHSSLSRSRSKELDDRPAVLSDGKFIYLPDEISIFSDKAENENLYKSLTRLESGCYEFNTFDFDLEKALERCRRCMTFKTLNLERRNQRVLSDLEAFFRLFPVSQLAADLFTLFEHGRLRRKLSHAYPGLLKETAPVMEKEALRIFREDDPVEAMFVLYVWIVLGRNVVNRFDFNGDITSQVKTFVELFEKRLREDDATEMCAELVAQTYEGMSALLVRTSGLKRIEDVYRPLKTPFDRRLRPGLFSDAFQSINRIAERIKAKLEEKGLRVYKSDIKRQLLVRHGSISHEDIQEILLVSPDSAGSGALNHHGVDIDLSWLDLSGLLGNNGTAGLERADVQGNVFWHQEWDCNLGDYLHSHVRVLDRQLTCCDGDFYTKTLEYHRGLVKQIRRAFEMLKPEGLQRLRQWVDGDEFDYRALVDFAVDKKAGWAPSDRLYIKRIKQHRDVAVLLLVDFSRSTANAVYGSEKRILDVEREAVVLFCEALEVVGDTYAVAGFSGSGRLSVDYLRVKDFEEKMNEDIQKRINAVRPMRSTRMGAAIRHAVDRLEQVPSRVRLLIILTDGFPNDLEYKQEYAIADTRRAIFEARSKNIYTHSITVNTPGDSKLDELYGNAFYNVISDVRELPDKLLRIYSSLTRN